MSVLHPTLCVVLQTRPEQKERLRLLQALFAQVCNALAPVVQAQRCWNRVALHHMTYKGLRTAFPGLGSQMVCNAIYAVCRAARWVYQGPGSATAPLGRLPQGPLPLLRFSDTAPVYFDRHTLSLKNQNLSLYTPDGRMRFRLDVGAEAEAAFLARKLAEVVLFLRDDGEFELRFSFEAVPSVAPPRRDPGTDTLLPEYLLVEKAQAA